MASKKPKLNQIIAVVQGKKSTGEKLLTEIYQHGLKNTSLVGFNRVYSPLMEDGEKFPNESQRLQSSVAESLRVLLPELTDYYDVVATQEQGNTRAAANIEVDNNVVLQNVPIGTLLFLEKRLEDLHTFVSNLPVLPSDKDWVFDKNRNAYVSYGHQTVKTQKVQEVIVRYEATKEHPAQTELVSVDRRIGNWNTTHISGAIPAQEREQYISKVRSLQVAVKKAREEANSIEVEQVSIGKNILDFIFGNRS